MAVTPVVVENYRKQLKDRIDSLDSIKTKGTVLFTVDDFIDTHELYEMPTFGIVYDGCGTKENQGDSKVQGIQSVAIITLYFTAVVVVEYTGEAGQNSIPDATAALDDIRSNVYGYRGISSRPWGFIGESPYHKADSGAAYYIQKWQIDVPLVGVSTN